LRTLPPSPDFFSTALSHDAALRPLDEALLAVLRIQPSEIDALDMEDYWFWVGAAEREAERRNRQLQGLFG
jgi:hypothetical protein